VPPTNPLRAATPAQQAPQAPQAPQPPVQQPQPQAIPNPLAGILGNAHVRATANGVPVNLPPEVINQLLNQHFLQHGQVPNLLATIQQHQQSVALRQNIANLQQQLQQYQQQREQATGSDEQQRLDNQITHLQEHIPLLEQQLAQLPQPRAAAAMRREEAGQTQQAERQPSSESLNSRPDQQPSGDVPPATSAPAQAVTPPAPNGASPSSEVLPPVENATPPPAVPGQPQSVSRSGVMPDGSRWSMNMTTVTTDGNQPQAPGIPAIAPPQFPHPPPGVPVFAQPQFPQQIPFPFMQHPGAIPGRMATPPAGLRPGGTPRSVSPARSVSEGQRRSGTPAAELQTRLEHTRREIQNVNRLLGVMQNGNMATGEPAPPLTEEARRQLQTYSASMVRHIDGFGADLNSLANALHPNVRSQPDFASLQALYRSVHAQGRAIQQQVQNLSSTTSPTSHPIQQQSEPAADSTANVLARGTGALLRNDQESSTRQQPTSPPPAGTAADSIISPQPPPSAAVTQGSLPVPDNVPATAPSPEIYLLTDPSGASQALVVGPTGHFTTSILPQEIAYALLAAQIPYDQMANEFSRIMREALFPTTSLGYFGPAPGLPHPPGAATIQQAQAAYLARQERRLARAAQAAAGGQAPQNMIQRAAQLNAAQPQAQGPAPAARAANGEVRDLLGPIMRNLWIAVRIAMFAYFFLASGRGYGRLLILSGAALIVYALNLGFMGEQMNGLWARFRAHFEALIGLPPHPQPVAAQANGEGAAAAPDPANTARRLVEQQQAQNRNWLRARLRQVERTIALFVASLWPGVGEGLIQAQERAENERRLAEETRVREEEEARKKKEEEENAEREKASEAGPSTVPVDSLAGTAATGADVAHDEGLSRVNKGKERATEDAAGAQEETPSARLDSKQPSLD
jgi:hypothetical protein